MSSQLSSDALTPLDESINLTTNRQSTSVVKKEEEKKEKEMADHVELEEKLEAKLNNDLTNLPRLMLRSTLNSIPSSNSNEKKEVGEDEGVSGFSIPSNSIGKIFCEKFGIKITRRQLQIVLAFLLIWLVGLTNESATGANLNAMQVYYNVDYEKISLVFLSNILGYLISCLSSYYLTHHYSFSTSLLLASLLQTLGSLTLALAPPFPIFVLSLSFLGVGSGLFDACLAMVMSHEEDKGLMSCYYSALAFGGAVGPLVVAGLGKLGASWNIFYWIPFGLTILLSAVAYPIFSTYKAPPDEVFEEEESVTVVDNVGGEAVVIEKKKMGVKARMIKSLKLKIVWIGFALCFLSFGFSDTISAWIVSYQITERGEAEDFARYQLAAVWLGIALGRIFFAFVGQKLSEKTFAILLLLATSGCLSLLWAIPHPISGFISLIFTGFFIGPITPQSLSMLSSHVTPSIRGSVISMAVAAGLAGACIMPLLFGVVAQRIKNGLNTLPGVLVGSCAIMIGIWIIVPMPRGKAEGVREKKEEEIIEVELEQV